MIQSTFVEARNDINAPALMRANGNSAALSSSLQRRTMLTPIHTVISR